MSGLLTQFKEFFLPLQHYFGELYPQSDVYQRNKIHKTQAKTSTTQFTSTDHKKKETGLQDIQTCALIDAFIFISLTVNISQNAKNSS
jgi:hypothetical protein